jgi:hypothetical protein
MFCCLRIVIHGEVAVTEIEGTGIEYERVSGICGMESISEKSVLTAKVSGISGIIRGTKNTLNWKVTVTPPGII